MKALFRFHPELANAGLLYDGSEERRNNYTLEGGDVHYLRPDLLVVGFSERIRPRRSISCARRCSQRRRHRRARGRHAEGADCDPPRHDLHSGGPRSLRGLPAVLRRARAFARCCTGGRGPRRAGDAELFRGAPARGPAVGADLCRRRAAHQPGAGAVELGLQLSGGAPRHPGELSPERRDAVRAHAVGFRVVPAVNFLAFDDWARRSIVP